MPSVITYSDGTTKAVNTAGLVVFTKNGMIHCQTEPAVQYPDGHVIWVLYDRGIHEWQELFPQLSMPSNLFCEWPLEDQVLFKLTVMDEI